MFAGTTLDLRSLDGGENTLRLSLGGEDLDIDPDELTVAGPIEVDLRLVVGEDTVQVRGTVAGTAVGACARCDVEVTRPFEASLDLIAIPRPDDVDPDEPVDDEDLLYYEGTALELGETLREHVLIDQPMALLCDEACRGLCPECGANLNETTCSCERPSTDPRWQALQDALNDRERE